MTTLETASLVLASIIFLVVAVPVLVFVGKLWFERRAKRRELDEHTDEYWRQIG